MLLILFQNASTFADDQNTFLCLQPLNLGSSEMVSMNGMMEMAMNLEGKTLPIKHIPGPEGVRGRNSENALILEKLGWEPTVTLADGLKITYFWIKSQVSSTTTSVYR